MNKYIAEFAYSIGDKVTVKEIFRPGVIESLIVDNRGMMYEVAYWDESSRCSVWLYDWELTDRKDEE